MKSSSAILLALCLCLSNNAGALSFSDFFGPRLNGVQTTRTALVPKNALDSIHRWNAIAINASGLAHTPVASGEIRTFGEQLGPGRSSRAMAIVHIEFLIPSTPSLAATEVTLGFNRRSRRSRSMPQSLRPRTIRSPHFIRRKLRLSIHSWLKISRRSATRSNVPTACR